MVMKTRRTNPHYQTITIKQVPTHTRQIQVKRELKIVLEIKEVQPNEE
jgi:hypothetical protein